MKTDELITKIKAQEGMEKVSKAQIKETINAFINVVLESLKEGDDIPLYGLGRIRSLVQKAREGYNPATGQRIQIPSRKTIRLSVSKAAKDFLND